MFIPEEEIKVESPEVDYISEIQNLKANSVSKEDYNRLREDNQKLIKALAHGEVLPQEVETKATINDLRNKLFNSELNNLEYCKTALELRNQLIDKEGYDPFLPQGQVVASTSDREAANRVASVMAECIDYADGDSQIFTNELMRRTVDIKKI